MLSDTSKNSDISNFTDIQLWEELKKENPDALKILFHKYYNELYFYGLKISKCEDRTVDAIQEIFMKLWEKRQTLSEVKYIKAYLFKILRNNLLKPQNKNIFSRLLPEENQKLETNFVISPEDFIIEQETQTKKKQIINLLLKELSSKQREILYLRFYCGLSIDEISETKSMAKQSVSNLLSRSLIIFRKKFKDYDITLVLAVLYQIIKSEPFIS